MTTVSLTNIESWERARKKKTTKTQEATGHSVENHELHDTVEEKKGTETPRKHSLVVYGCRFQHAMGFSDKRDYYVSF